MSLYERIKNRRNELNMSQDELATKLGYKSRSTIAKIEAGINDIPQSKIQAFADALNTTPSHLMGWGKIEEDYQHSTDLGYTYFEGLMKWSEDKLLKKHETTIIRGHMSDLFLKYKLLIEQYVYAQRSWDREKEIFSKFYKGKDDSLSDEEIKELYLKHELKNGIEDLTNWINSLPSWIVREESKYNEVLGQDLSKQSHLLPNAAHEIEGTSSEDKDHDDAIMDDEDF